MKKSCELKENCGWGRKYTRDGSPVHHRAHAHSIHSHLGSIQSLESAHSTPFSPSSSNIYVTWFGSDDISDLKEIWKRFSCVKCSALNIAERSSCVCFSNGKEHWDIPRSTPWRNLPAALRKSLFDSSNASWHFAPVEPLTWISPCFLMSFPPPLIH